jgi:hypothetical protein
MTVFCVVAQCILAEVYRRFRGVCRAISLMIEAGNTSETSVNFYQNTQRNNPEDSHLHTRLLENLKSHKGFVV